MIKDIMNHNADAVAGQKEMDALKKYFPQCFHADDEFDIEAFKAALPGGTTITDETSGFNWLGKNYARMLTNMDTTTLIRPDEEHNAKPENKDSQNVYISGDNLDALQHLVKSYSGKVKVIYIDPPYNTGSDGFVYNDKFNFTAEELAKRLDVSRERAERILSMTRRGSASHAAWLTFMLPRLSFARDLLTDDGVIFISIDDNEQANLKRLCDEVFGEENFVGQIIWKNVTDNNPTQITSEHEYTYRCILTNDYESSAREIVEFYNLRGGKERIFDDMNNGFGWNRLPKSFMAENTVFLLLTALIRNFYKAIIQRLDVKKFGLNTTSRIKAFVFRFISVPAKWIRTSRRNVLNIYTYNNAYAEVFQTDFG